MGQKTTCQATVAPVATWLTVAGRQILEDIVAVYEAEGGVPFINGQPEGVPSRAGLVRRRRPPPAPSRPSSLSD